MVFSSFLVVLSGLVVVWCLVVFCQTASFLGIALFGDGENSHLSRLHTGRSPLRYRSPGLR